MKYRTATQLEITLEERTALIKVKAFLKKLDVPKDIDSRDSHRYDEVEQPGEAKFNMNRSIARYDCGTACCIGGWMALQMEGVALTKVVVVETNVRRKVQTYVDKADRLYRLFYPPQGGIDYDTITPLHAIRVITHFLTTGLIDWTK